MSAFFRTVARLGEPDVADRLVRQEVSSLLEALAIVPDWRDPRGVRFDLPVILGLAVFATCCGAETFAEIAEITADLDEVILAGFGLRRRPPSAATFRRNLNAVDPVALDDALCVWAADLPARQEDSPQPRPEVPGPVGRRVVALDGKTLRGARSFDETGTMAQQAVLEAVCQDTGAVLGQVEIACGDENAAGLGMLDLLAARLGGLEGVTLSTDAKHTTVAFTKKVTELGGWWVLTVKRNATATHAALSPLPWDQVPNVHVARDKGHGRIETRTIRMLEVPDHVHLPLTGAKQAGLVRRHVYRKKTITSPHTWTRETVHIATSLPAELADPSALARMIRGHWRCEAHHWRRDVLYGEDRHTARTGHGPVNMACLRNTAITRHARNGPINLAKTLRACNRHPQRALHAITK